MEYNTDILQAYVKMVPAFCVLGVLLLVSVVFIFRLNRDDLVRMMGGRGFFLVGIMSIIFLLSSIELFGGRAWAGDALKLLMGVFAGAGAAYMGMSRGEKNDQEPALRAGGGLSHTSSYLLPPAAHSAQRIDHELHFMTARPNPAQDIQNATEVALVAGWNLMSVEISTKGFDGIILVFTRPSTGPARLLRINVDGQVSEVAAG